MKKKLLLAFIPLLALASCSSVKEAFVPFLDEMDGLPAIHRDASEHKTYLMLSPFGSIENYEGISAKGNPSGTYYENTVLLIAEEGTLLPDATQVKTTVSGASFRGWAYYDEENDHVWPDYYTTVPAKSGLALKAIFDGTVTSGGGSTPEPTPQPTSSTYGIKFSTGTIISATHTGMDNGFDQWVISNQTFNKDDVFSLYDSGTKASWAVKIDGYSFGGDSAESTKWQEYLTQNGSESYTVVQSFTGTLYIKLQYENDQLYIGLA